MIIQGESALRGLIKASRPKATNLSRSLNIRPIDPGKSPRLHNASVMPTKQVIEKASRTYTIIPVQ